MDSSVDSHEPRVIFLFLFRGLQCWLSQTVMYFFMMNRKFSIVSLMKWISMLNLQMNGVSGKTLFKRNLRSKYTIWISVNTVHLNLEWRVLHDLCLIRIKPLVSRILGFETNFFFNVHVLKKIHHSYDGFFWDIQLRIVFSSVRFSLWILCFVCQKLFLPFSNSIKRLLIFSWLSVWISVIMPYQYHQSLSVTNTSRVFLA